MTKENTKAEIELVQELISKSEDEFEKKLTYIGAGALLLSLTLIEKLIRLENSEILFFLIFGWSLLVWSLLINLISHLISKIHFRNAQKEIRNNIEYQIREKNYKKRLCISESLNWSSVISLILGIIFLIVFVSVNATKTNHKSDKLNKPDTLNVKIVN